MAKAVSHSAAVVSIHRAKLKYVVDTKPGFRRVRSSRSSFRYFDQSGRRCRPADVERIKALAIPPAWTQVWICPEAHGHIQATGRDQRGRKQYRYHSRWREVRDTAKYDSLISFAEVLPKIRLAAEHGMRGL